VTGGLGRQTDVDGFSMVLRFVTARPTDIFARILT
jgi:hypothetical protein